MIVFHGPFKPKKPDIPKAATPEGDIEAEAKAAEEAQRRARAALVAGGGRQGSLLTGGTSPGQGRLRTLLGG